MTKMAVKAKFERWHNHIDGNIEIRPECGKLSMYFDFENFEKDAQAHIDILRRIVGEYDEKAKQYEEGREER